MFDTEDYSEIKSNAPAGDDIDKRRKQKRQITELTVYVASNDQSLNLQTDESYVLEIEAPTSSLSVGIKSCLASSAHFIRRLDDKLCIPKAVKQGGSSIQTCLYQCRQIQSLERYMVWRHSHSC